MATHRITTPEPGHNGMVGDVAFANGVAEIDEATYPAELVYFRAAGYGVEDLAPVEERDVDGDGVLDKLPRKNASEASWRTFAVEHGMTQEEADSLTRDELVAHFGSKEENK